MCMYVIISKDAKLVTVTMIFISIINDGKNESVSTEYFKTQAPAF